MEVAVELPELGHVVILRDGLERRERVDDRLDLLVGHRVDRPADHLALDDPAQVVEPAEILEIDARGDGGALRQRDDEALGLQPPDGLADRDVADAEALLELGDPDPLARLDVAREQRPPQQER